MDPRHLEKRRSEHTGSSRAAALGANNGIASTANLVLGVAAAQATHRNVLVAGAMSMAAGEYVSLYSQADMKRERKEIKKDCSGESKELAAIYVDRGLDPALATQVADQLMAHYVVGAGVPLFVMALALEARLIPIVSVTSLVFLTLLGGAAAHVCRWVKCESRSGVRWPWG